MNVFCFMEENETPENQYHWRLVNIIVKKTSYIVAAMPSYNGLYME